jgi:hypothetical protein
MAATRPSLTHRQDFVIGPASLLEANRGHRRIFPNLYLSDREEFLPVGSKYVTVRYGQGACYRHAAPA